MLKKWWRGTARPIESWGNGVTYISLTPDRSWSSRTAHKLVAFWQKHWPVLVGFAIAIAGLFVKGK